jgi:hypothetical protein
LTDEACTLLFYTAWTKQKEKAAMEDLNLYSLNTAYNESRRAECNADLYVARAARRLYQWACFSATLNGLKTFLLRKPNRLQALNTAMHPSLVGNAHYTGIHSVPLYAIHGSENRVDDFDAGFHPLRPHIQARWLSIASACLRGVPMPPVVLIQVGNAYYVRDGHHRISVARAMGQEMIDAEVSVWGYPSRRPASEEAVQSAPQPA